MKLQLKQIISLLLLSRLTLSLTGICTESRFSYTTANFICMRNSGFQSTDVIMVSNFDAVPAPDQQNLINTLNSGMNVSIVLIPCRIRSPVEMVRELAKIVSKDSVYRVWLGPDSSSDIRCSWFYDDPVGNCQFFTALIT